MPEIASLPNFSSLPKLAPAEPHPRHAQLAQRIVETALAKHWPEGQRVTEQELAESLDVSRTPIRSALRLLQELGIVAMGPSRGYVLARGSEALQGFTLAARRPAEEALRARIIGDRLAGQLETEPSQADLARRYEVSLPTLQRVFQRMEQEGLVIRSGWRWSFLPSLETMLSQRASYEIRLMLEPASLLLPGFRTDPGLVRQLRNDHGALLDDLGLTERDPMRIFALDVRFHEVLAGFGRNPFVLNVVRQQNALRRLLEVKTYGDRERVGAWCREHLAILDAVGRGNLAKGSELLRAHLLRAEAALRAANDSGDAARSGP